MAGLITKLKSVASPPKPVPPLEANPILHFFEVGKEVSTAGPGLIWKVHDAFRKEDGKECSVFVLVKSMAEKMYRPTKQKKEKELVIDSIRNTILMLDRVRHPKMLQIVHPIEEGALTLAFAAEPILASLHDILTWQEHNQQAEDPPTVPPQRPCYSPPPLIGEDKPDEPPKIKDCWFVEMELKYGILQVVDALCYMHYTAKLVHRNVSPHTILVNKRGTWKLFGMDFCENVVSIDPTDMINVPMYNIKVSKFAQPHLDYMPPETMFNGQCNILSDMYSLGLVIIALFNQGRPLLQSHCNPLNYMKQMESMKEQLSLVMPRIPETLQEAVIRLLSRDTNPRPTTQLLPLIKYFKCPIERCMSELAVCALQFLDVVNTKDGMHRTHFYKVVLMESLPYIPEKILWMHVWPSLQMEVKAGEAVGGVIVPIMWLTDIAPEDIFRESILPTLQQIYCRNLMTNPKCEAASISFLEQMHILLKRCAHEEVYSEIVPILVTALDDSANILRQTAGLVALLNCVDYLGDDVLHEHVLSKVRCILERNPDDMKNTNLILGFYERALHRFEEDDIVDHVIPAMLYMKLVDPDIISRVVKIYKILIAEKKYGLTTAVMAQRMLPSLAPQAVNESLNVEQYHHLIEILYDLLDRIDEFQRAVVEGGGPGMPRVERPSRGFRHRRSTDNVLGGVEVAFNIPNLRVERERKTSSVDDMARKPHHSAPPGPVKSDGSESSVGNGIRRIGQWIFGSNNSTNSNNENFLRVATSVFPNRRLSDNSLLSPRVQNPPSSASSPGGTPGGSNTALPARRHSSIGQERRASQSGHVNLSPPTVSRGRTAYRGRGSGSSLSVPVQAHPVGGSMSNASTSAPYLGASNTSVASARGSRRPSACPSNASQLSHMSRASHASQHSHASAASGGLMQHIQTGVVRQPPTVSPAVANAAPPTGVNVVPPTVINVVPPPPPVPPRNIRALPSLWLSTALAAGNRALAGTFNRFNN